VTDRTPGAEAGAMREVFGTEARKVTGDEINAAYQKADKAAAEKAAQAWMKAAKKIVEPSREEIVKSGVMYIAMQDLMKQHRSPALTIDCLNLFYGGKLAAYPCLGLFQFNNDGLVGACEADLRSTFTMLAMNYLTGRPGYISDPVIDTSKNQIIYAHCVAPSKVYGPAGAAAPFHIRSHSEDRKGASVRVLLPLNEMTTTLEISPQKKEVVFHQGRSVANIDEDKACRTKLAVEVKDIDKLMLEWDRWGWHRVTYYGDLKRPVETLAALSGLQLVVEG
jgi:L-fucose isomerase-like protein